MHELSIAFELVEIAKETARSNSARSISEIEIELGEKSGVDVPSLETAIKAVSANTIAEKASIKICQTEAIARCTTCGYEFACGKLPECPKCHSFFVKIVQGKELRIKSIVIE